MERVTIADLATPKFDVTVQVDEMANIRVNATAHYIGYNVTEYRGCSLTLGETRNAATVSELVYNACMAAFLRASQGRNNAAYSKAATLMRINVERAIVQDAIACLVDGADVNLFKDGDLGVFYAYILR